MSHLALQIRAIVMQCNTGARYVRIKELFWDEDGNNVNHLLEREITPDDIEEIIFGVDGEEPTPLIRREGDVYVVFGRTGNGRLLHVVGEFPEPGVFRPFGARDMDVDQKRAFKKRGK